MPISHQTTLTVVTARRLTAKSLYKLIFLSGLIPGAFFFFILGISAANGAETLRLNDAYVTGPSALLLSAILFIPFLAAASALLWLLAAPGLFFWSLFRSIQLEFKE